MAQATDVLRIAANEIGYSEQGDKSTGTKYGRWYAERMNSSYFAQEGVPWCAMFTSWVFDKANQSAPGLPAASCSVIRNAAKNTKYHIQDKKQAIAGDIVLFDWDGNGGPDHVGIVELNKGSYIQTIEGNTGNGEVLRRTRNWSTVYMIIRPEYDTNRQLTESDFAAIGNQTYTGKEIKPSITSTTDATFNVTYKDNINVGYGKAICTGTDKYVDTVTLQFKILPKSLVGYNDVDPTAWYVDTIANAVERGFISGYSSDTLAPLDSCTRANAICMIANAAGYKAPEGFEDVPQPTYYYEALKWAEKQNIIHGSNNTFRPDDICLRCDFIVMLYNLSGNPTVSSFPTSYSDWEAVPEYAQQAVAWAVNNKIVSGSNNKLNPTSNCTRCEAAAMLVNHANLKP